MILRFAIPIFFSSVFFFWCDGQPCTANDALVNNVTKTLLANFAEIPQTDGIRRGESIFNREKAKFNVTKDYGFLVDQPANHLKSLIEGWTSKGLLGSGANMVWYRFNQTLGRKAKGSYTGRTSNPSMATWTSLQFSSARTGEGRLSAAYAFLTLKDKDSRVSTTDPESNDLFEFVHYKNRKNFNTELASELAKFSTRFDRCH